MRLVTMALGAILLGSGLAAALLPVFSPTTALSDVGAAATWVGRFEAMGPLVQRGFVPEPFEEQRDVSEVVASIYRSLGLELLGDHRAQMDAQVAALHPALAKFLQQLLGAIDVGMADWARATAVLTAEDLEILSGEGHGSEVQAILGKVDGRFLDRSLMRVLGVLDSAPSVTMPAGGTEIGLFPGPNTGMIFNDPYNLILVGGPGQSVFRGNTLQSLWNVMDATMTILNVDVEGSDIYYNDPGTARPWPEIVCFYGSCNRGLPLSISFDPVGNDQYLPNKVGSICCSASVGFGSFFGLGLLVDSVGEDLYVPKGGATEGSAHRRGLGVFLDAVGNDRIWGGQAGSQGEAVDEGSLGILLELQGDDDYVASHFSQGRGAAGGTGALFDLDGRDRYRAGEFSRASIGGGSGVAVFLESCGADSYLTLPGTNGAMWGGNMAYGVDFATDC